MSSADFNFANLSQEQISELKNVEQKINGNLNEDVIILAYTKK